MVRDGVNRLFRRIPAGSLYLIGTLPVIWLFWRGATGGLGVDPVKVIEHELGKLAFQCLIAALAVGPLRRYAGINLQKFRRALGVLAFSYALIHLGVWLALDIQFLWAQIWADLVKRPYITFGMTGLLMMLPLAVTSNDLSIRRMGAAAWRRLHLLAYPAALAGATHYLMSVKAWPLEPVLYAAAVAGLVALRIRGSVNLRPNAAQKDVPGAR
jgi:sulfoxide reductase heme-binding subunit YedZ